MSSLKIHVISAWTCSFDAVAGVGCSKDSDCIKTKYTQAACKTKVCSCVSPYRPITTGCGQKLSKPTLSFDGFPSSLVWAYEGKKGVTLRCYTSEYQSDVSEVIWKFGDKTLKESKDTLTIDINETSAASSYRCALAPIGQPNSSLTSEDSDAFKITLLKTGTLPTGDWKPVLDTTVKAIPDHKVPLSCSNLPIGIDAEIEYFEKDSSEPVEDTNYVFTKDVEVSCKVTLKSDKLTSRESKAVKVSSTDNIDGMTVSIVGHDPRLNSLTVRTNQSLELQCQNNGKVAVLPMSVSLYWKVGDKTDPITSLLNDKLRVDTSVPGTTVYKCEGSFGYSPGRPDKESRSITITVADDPLPVPKVKVSPVQPSPDSHVTMECGENLGDDVTYTWRKNGKVIVGQKDRVIQVHAIGVKADKYGCMATKDGYSVRSEETGTTVKPNTPTLSVTNSPKAFNKGATYTLSCKTTPISTDVTFIFKRNQTSLPGKSHQHILAHVTDADNGMYTCHAELDGVYTDASNIVTISVGAAGKYCASNSDCTGRGYAETCTDHRCDCKSGYEKKGDKCASSAVAVNISALALIFCVVFGHVVQRKD